MQYTTSAINTSVLSLPSFIIDCAYSKGVHLIEQMSVTLLHKMYAGMYLARHKLTQSQINADCRGKLSKVW